MLPDVAYTRMFFTMLKMMKLNRVWNTAKMLMTVSDDDNGKSDPIEIELMVPHDSKITVTMEQMLEHNVVIANNSNATKLKMATPNEPINVDSKNKQFATTIHTLAYINTHAMMLNA